jgi:phage terminase small subunit
MGRRPKRKIIEADLSAEPLTTVPDPPTKRLGVHGVAYWRRLAPILVAQRRLTPLLLEALESLCSEWNSYVRLQLWLQRSIKRWTSKTANGYEQETPQVRQMRTALREVQRLWVLLGITPRESRRIDGSAARLVEFAKQKTAGDEAERPPASGCC